MCRLLFLFLSQRRRRRRRRCRHFNKFRPTRPFCPPPERRHQRRPSYALESLPPSASVLGLGSSPVAVVCLRASARKWAGRALGSRRSVCVSVSVKTTRAATGAKSPPQRNLFALICDDGHDADGYDDGHDGHDDQDDGLRLAKLASLCLPVAPHLNFWPEFEPRARPLAAN